METPRKAGQLLGKKKSRRRLEYKNPRPRNPSWTSWETILMAEMVKSRPLLVMQQVMSMKWRLN